MMQTDCHMIMPAATTMCTDMAQPPDLGGIWEEGGGLEGISRPFFKMHLCIIRQLGSIEFNFEYEYSKD